MENTKMLAFVATPGPGLSSSQRGNGFCSNERSRKFELPRRSKRSRRVVIRATASNTDTAQKTIFEYGISRSDYATGELAKYPIQLMACDMDGTLLNRAVQVTQTNIRAVKRLLSETDVLFVPATGKSRYGALRSMGALGDHLNDLYPKGCPGVFLQGLIVFGVDGQVLYENKCNPSLADSVIQLSNDLKLDLIAYSRDSILCERSSHYTDLLPTYHEPAPEELGAWESAVGSRPINKFIFMAEPHEIDRVRPLVAQQIGNTGVLTQAQGNMLEVLPPKSSKGNGVRLLLDHVGISPENVLAIGDAENDLEMLSMVRYSCAVENALPSVKAVARYTDIRSNNDSGVAHAIERFIFNEMDSKA